jgi:Family of unknown function (DUF5694)
MHTRRFFVTRAVFLAIALGMVNANSMAAGIAATASTPDAASQSCLDSATPVLLLGTYHMDNPGRDMMNLQVDDVLAPKRQREIAELVDDLARFRPTKILIEAEYGNPDAQTKYSQYLAGKYELGRDEREQVAFRLARKMNLSQIYGVDFPMDLDDKGLNQLMKDDPDRTNKTMQALGVDGAQEMKKQQELLDRDTVVEFYRFQNSDEAIEHNHSFYFKYFVPLAEGTNYAGADLVASWYQRNLRILNNIERIGIQKNDRVFILFGQGHVKLLRDFINATPGFCVTETGSYLK